MLAISINLIIGECKMTAQELKEKLDILKANFVLEDHLDEDELKEFNEAKEALEPDSDKLNQFIESVFNDVKEHAENKLMTSYYENIQKELKDISEKYNISLVATFASNDNLDLGRNVRYTKSGLIYLGLVQQLKKGF